MKHSDEQNIGWVGNNSSDYRKPDFTNRDSEPVDVRWCPDCNRPESLCDCDN